MRKQLRVRNALLSLLLFIAIVVPAAVYGQSFGGGTLPEGFSQTPLQATGTTGQILQSNGGTALPTYTSNPGSGTALVSVTTNALALTRTAVADTAHTQIATESIIAYTSLTATRNVTLITAGIKTGQILIIKDESGLAGTSAITTSGVLVDGANPSISANFGVLRLYYNGATYSSW